MSAGRSSQLAACFSVERTKYLMLLEVDAGQVRAPGRASACGRNSFRPFSRRSSIHSGSFFLAEMSRTTSSDRPRRADSPAASESAQPNLYRSSPSSSGCAVVVMRRCLRADWSSWSCGRRADVRQATGAVTCVVQIPSPCAIVARRCTGVPSSRPNASVSASHSCGNSAATCATGQWCWQSCSPPGCSPPPVASAGRTGRRGRVAVRRQRLGERLHPLARPARLHHRPVPALQVGDLPAGELGDRLGPGHLGEEPERAGGQVVVGVLEGAAARVGDREQLGRAAAAAAAVAPRVPGLDHAVGQQVVQVPADRGRGQAEPGAQPGRGDRPVLQDQPGDPGPGAPLGAQVGHGARGAGRGDGGLGRGGGARASRARGGGARASLGRGAGARASEVRQAAATGGTGACVTDATGASCVTAAARNRERACPVHAFHNISVA